MTHLLYVNDNHRLYVCHVTREAAEAVAAKCRESETMGWTYETEAVTGGFAILISDETGHHMGLI